ncbi:cytochrome C oxidase subunit III [Nonlabens tegetincola]|uniref:cbb3-type cytochrome c oxidase N-terminal domain-containing protein n=1 Tax=Nonlabens tegetincola TaxID=323273 RepID=UPI000A2087F3|nr:cbb3-type cytochrome c oxidase N-terminal domain-containing protein [Nonlabens tegetincola]ARN71535.1 cytochrome C oxidase subunit III [Nonlabens tegetincola]
MRTLSSYIRVGVFAVVASGLLMFVASPDQPFSAFEKVWFWPLVALLIILMIAGEASISTLKAVLYNTLDKEAKERYDLAEKTRKENQFARIKRVYKKSLDSKPIESEHEIVLDHNYDGIQELDNNLPPWWLYMFYATIIFGVVYLARFHVFNVYDQASEFETEMEIARAQVEEWKKTAKDLVDVNTVTLLTDASDLNAGKEIFNQNCAACHKVDGGGGIGPNLTDSYWILGGGIKNIFNTISEGGRSGKGMVPWKTELKPAQIAQVASYVMQFEGTTPAEPKEPQGEIWNNPDAPDKMIIENPAKTIVTDSLQNSVVTNSKFN